MNFLLEPGAGARGPGTATLTCAALGLGFLTVSGCGAIVRASAKGGSSAGASGKKGSSGDGSSGPPPGGGDESVCGSDLRNCDAIDLESKPNTVARKTGYSVKQINDAIHRVKGQPGWRGIGGNKNPDMLIDPNSGEVYPKKPDGTPGDSIGNIFDYLPEKP
jgi:hypothetical protein